MTRYYLPSYYLVIVMALLKLSLPVLTVEELWLYRSASLRVSKLLMLAL